MADISPWKRPDEVMVLHRLKMKKKALQERMRQPNISKQKENSSSPCELNFTSILRNEKRKNPFSKALDASQSEKKVKAIDDSQLDESSDKTLYQLLNLSSPRLKERSDAADDTAEKLTSFTNLLHKYSQEHVPVDGKGGEAKVRKLAIDWSLKTKLRLMSPKPFAWNQRLKASEEASGITGFVRCLNTSNSNTLDTSHHSQFHQKCLYWQHPHLPWLQLFPRSGNRSSASSSLVGNEQAQAALHRDWTDSFRSLFQLVRARQCPYFYMCANTFTCLFRAAGMNGADETCVFISPTTRGFRETLRQEDIDFTMPLRPKKRGSSMNSSADSHSQDDKQKNCSLDSCYETSDETRSQEQISQESESKQQEGDVHCEEDEEEVEPDQFLTELGIDSNEIKRINQSQARIKQAVESRVDSAIESLVRVSGVDAQALFNFLLNCKSVTAPIGPFAGVPPTLLAPNAFQGGTLRAVSVRANTIYSEHTKYYSIEMKGPLLPTAIHSLFDLLKSCSNEFSATFAPLQASVAFSRAAHHIAQENSQAENEANNTPFNKENLSDCGLDLSLLQYFCHSDPTNIRQIDAIKYNPDDNSYTF